MTGVEVMAIAGVVSALAGAAGTVMSLTQKGQVADNNAAALQADADAARDAAKAEADDIRRRGEREQGKLRANAGASGLIAEAGSPYELLLDNAEEIELDAQRRLFRGETEAQRYEGQAANQRSSKPGVGSYLSAGAGLLEGGFKAYSLLDKGNSAPKTPVPSGSG